MIKNTLLLLFLCGILVLTMQVFADINLGDEAAKTYFITYGYDQTASRNLVTAIYLDYRLFDSLFEAGILLVATAGIFFLTKKD